MKYFPSLNRGLHRFFLFVYLSSPPDFLPACNPDNPQNLKNTILNCTWNSTGWWTGLGLCWSLHRAKAPLFQGRRQPRLWATQICTCYIAQIGAAQDGDTAKLHPPPQAGQPPGQPSMCSVPLSIQKPPNLPYWM